jgi:hypothetical protein
MDYLAKLVVFTSSDRCPPDTPLRVQIRTQDPGRSTADIDSIKNETSRNRR